MLLLMRKVVVYYPISTSNHNMISVNRAAHMLYIILFLHQTTTTNYTNHESEKLYIILFLHQTTTRPHHENNRDALYIILFLHQTTTATQSFSKYRSLYIILFLHQTTTTASDGFHNSRCILSYFYIKPQRAADELPLPGVVYYPISTSNHNVPPLYQYVAAVVYYPISTSNHNPFTLRPTLIFVVYYPISTSNHNDIVAHACGLRVVYYPISTSNHNLGCKTDWFFTNYARYSVAKTGLRVRRSGYDTVFSPQFYAKIIKKTPIVADM